MLTQGRRKLFFGRGGEDEYKCQPLWLTDKEKKFKSHWLKSPEGSKNITFG